MSGMKQRDYPNHWIPARNLSVVWINAQRPFNEREAQHIADTFDPDAMDPLTVTMPNGKGIYHIIDGQTRHGAILRLWGDDQKVPCRVLNTKSPAEAARIWLKMNQGHKRPHAVDVFRVEVTSGDDIATAVGKIVRDMGFRVAMGPDDGVISCVTALKRIYAKYGEAALTWTLGTIREVWGKDRNASHGAVVEGFALLLTEHPTVERKRLVDKTSKKYTAAALIGAARTHRGMFGGNLPESIAALLVQAYNHNLRTGARLGDEQADAA